MPTKRSLPCHASTVYLASTGLLVKVFVMDNGKVYSHKLRLNSLINIVTPLPA